MMTNNMIINSKMTSDINTSNLTMNIETISNQIMSTTGAINRRIISKIKMWNIITNNRIKRIRTTIREIMSSKITSVRATTKDKEDTHSMHK